MTIKECYAEFGGDYDSVLSRLQREQLVEKFLLKFLKDPSVSQYLCAMENGNYDEALRAVHTLKGICLNLSFSALYENSALATAALKEKNPSEAADGIAQLTENYRRIIAAVEAYQAQREETAP